MYGRNLKQTEHPATQNADISLRVTVLKFGHVMCLELASKVISSLFIIIKDIMGNSHQKGYLFNIRAICSVLCMDSLANITRMTLKCHPPQARIQHFELGGGGMICHLGGPYGCDKLTRARNKKKWTSTLGGGGD